MVADIIIAAVVLAVGVVGIIKGISTGYLNMRKDIITIMLKGAIKISISAKTPPGQIEKLIEVLSKEYDNTKAKIDNKEAGFVISEFFIFLVPGIIALLLTGAFIYLLVMNHSDPNYSTPKELSSAMATIIGYFFGVGVSSAANKSKTLTEEDIKRIIGGT